MPFSDIFYHFAICLWFRDILALSAGPLTKRIVKKNLIIKIPAENTSDLAGISFLVLLTYTRREDHKIFPWKLVAKEKYSLKCRNYFWLFTYFNISYHKNNGYLMVSSLQHILCHVQRFSILWTQNIVKCIPVLFTHILFFLLDTFMGCIEGSHGNAVGWGAALQAGRSRVQFPIVPFQYFIDLILPAALCPWDRLRL
jgi:hypothetical protein